VYSAGLSGAEAVGKHWQILAIIGKHWHILTKVGKYWQK
jgi:hypothetical protein